MTQYHMFDVSVISIADVIHHLIQCYIILATAHHVYVKR